MSLNVPQCLTPHQVTKTHNFINQLSHVWEVNILPKIYGVFTKLGDLLTNFRLFALAFEEDNLVTDSPFLEKLNRWLLLF